MVVAERRMGGVAESGVWEGGDIRTNQAIN